VDALTRPVVISSVKFGALEEIVVTFLRPLAVFESSGKRTFISVDSHTVDVDHAQILKNTNILSLSGP
jgi:hypothetical protein